MATSGSITTNEVSGRSLTFSWSVKNQSISGNYTDINWSLVGSGSASGYVYGGSFTVNINGKTEYSSATRIPIYQGTVIKSDTARIYHAPDGTSGLDVYIESAIYTYGINATASGSWELPTIPRQAILTGADNFNDEQNPKITYSNPAGNSVTTLQACISLTGAVADVPYRDISKTGTSYTFNLTETERNTLRNSIPNSTSRTVKFLVKTVIGGNTYYSTLEKTFTIVNANPVFSNFIYEDVDVKTTALTGNNQKFISKYSDIKVTIPVANKMIAQKGATATTYTAVIGDTSKNIAYSDIADVFTTINNISSNTVSVFAKDSRNNQTQVVKALDVINYIEPKISSMFFNRKDGVGETVLITGNGTYMNVDFGAVVNTIETIEFRRKEKESGTWSSWTSIKGYFNFNGGTFTNKLTNELIGTSWTFGVEYDVEVRITDKLASYTFPLEVNSGKTLMTAVKNKGVCFGGIYNLEVGGPLQVNEKSILDLTYPVGAIYMSVVNTNPATLFGGTWVEWGKGRVPVGVDTSQTEFNNVEKTGGTKTVTLTIAQMPNHNHNTSDSRDNAIPRRAWLSSGSDLFQIGSGPGYPVGELNAVGGGQAHNNLQPYITCYMWKRTA